MYVDTGNRWYLCIKSDQHFADMYQSINYPQTPSSASYEVSVVCNVHIRL